MAGGRETGRAPKAAPERKILKRIYKNQGGNQMDFITEKDRIYTTDAEGNVLAEIRFLEAEPKVFCITYTFVDASLRGQGVADASCSKHCPSAGRHGDCYLFLCASLAGNTQKTRVETGVDVFHKSHFKQNTKRPQEMPMCKTHWIPAVFLFMRTGS